MTDLVEIDRLSVVFGGQLRAVSFRIAEGETFGLVGESGSGKTTVAKALVGLNPATGGSVRYAGRDIAGLGRRDLMWFRGEAQIIFQDPIVLKGEIPSPLDPPPGCRFHTRCPRVEARCRVEEPQLRPMGTDRMAACHFPLVSAP